MILLPAIDIRGGHAVRLLQGDFDAEVVYADDPLEAARAWVAGGARALHVVDLDGARAGEPMSLAHLRRIAVELPVPVQYGGGLRSPAAVEAAIDEGAQRVVLGTAALTDDAFLDAMLAAHGERVAVAVDVRGGRVAVSGWLEDTRSSVEAVLARLDGRGVSRFIFTDVERDGMLDGPDPETVRGVAETVSGELVYSGGIGSLDHLVALRDLALENLIGVICGKALYERRFTVAEAQAALDEVAA